jgi:hypothetical protein
MLRATREKIAKTHKKNRFALRAKGIMLAPLSAFFWLFSAWALAATREKTSTKH